MDYAPFLTALTHVFVQRLRYNEPLAQHVTFRIGGPAEFFLTVETVEELVQAVSLAQQYQIPWFILGSGANLLISDAGIKGLTMIFSRFSRLTGLNNPVNFDNIKNPVNLLIPSILVPGGVNLSNLARQCAKHGLSGLEWAVGIPGTVGGAVVNNAGAYGSNIAACLVQAELFIPTTRERVWYPARWFEFGYRTSRLKKVKNEVVLQAKFQLTPAPMTEIEARLHEYSAKRKASQPTGATIGSMFKNPPGDYAGRLIEAAGLKGYRIGQAQISPKHANFFINLGGATSAEMLALVQMAQDTVEREFGVKLELEIEVINYGGF